jgi:glutamate--cysteine ligase
MEHQGNSYVRFVLSQARKHRDTILALPLSPEVAERFAREAGESIDAQRRLEAADAVPFETYRQQYLAPIRLSE